MSDSCWEEFKRDREAKWREEELWDNYYDDLEYERELEEEFKRDREAKWREEELWDNYYDDLEYERELEMELEMDEDEQTERSE